MDLAIVYITEAHADDEWPISGKYKYNQPITNSERKIVASDFIVQCQAEVLPVYLDPLPGNPFENQYASWPIRFYIFENQGEGVVLSYLGMPHECTYDLIALRDWIKQWIAIHC